MLGQRSVDGCKGRFTTGWNCSNFKLTKVLVLKNIVNSLI